MKFLNFIHCVLIISTCPLYISHLHDLFFIIINNPLSPISVAHMHLGMWPPNGTWEIYQWPWPQRIKRMTLPPSKLPIALLTGEASGFPIPPHLHWLNSVQVITADVSWCVHQPWRVQKIACPRSPPHQMLPILPPLWNIGFKGWSCVSAFKAGIVLTGFFLYSLFFIIKRIFESIPSDQWSYALRNSDHWFFVLFFFSNENNKATGKSHSWNMKHPNPT